MLPDESVQLTTARIALIRFVDREDAGTLYNSLSDTLSLIMTNGANPGEQFIPTPATFDSWYFVLQLMDHLHAIAAEPPTGAEKDAPRIFGE